MAPWLNPITSRRLESHFRTLAQRSTVLRVRLQLSGNRLTDQAISDWPAATRIRHLGHGLGHAGQLSRPIWLSGGQRSTLNFRFPSSRGSKAKSAEALRPPSGDEREMSNDLEPIIQIQSRSTCFTIQSNPHNTMTIRATGNNPAAMHISDDIADSGP